MTHSFDKNYWDQIWRGDRAASMGASETNLHLIQQLSDLAPGTALDAGCGSGAEAIWLAQHGWQVTGADVAAAALAFAAERAAASGVADRVQWVEGDLSVWEPHAQYDLVTTHYAHPAIPQLDFYDRIASWVAPAGTLFIVGHLHQESDVGPGHTDDPDEPPQSASVTAADITARLDPTVWEIQTAQESQRTLTGPDGHVTSLHDVVVKASRAKSVTRASQ